ncbi:MAG TPA: AraC family transcriptional regulator [Deltaproteobacteria bacterium]|nr:AraC family transcriptional regulator [Deltaproteobacteria bacterium]
MADCAITHMSYTNADIGPIRALTAQWLIKQLAGMGIEASRLLEGTKIECGWLDEEDAFITYPEYERLIANALDATQERALGLKLGRTVNLALFGAFGYALMSSRTLEDAANVFLKYQDLPGQLTRISMKHSGPERLIRFDPLYPLTGRILTYAMEEVLSTTYYGMVFLVNRDITLSEVCLGYPAPGHARLYEEMFRCPVRFGAKGSFMRMDAGIFCLPVRTANQSVYEYCTRFCEDMLEGFRKSDQFIDRIRNVILTSPGKFLKAGEMARELGMGTRTLTRRLQERNTSYKKIISEVRSDLAMKYLAGTNLTIDQISDLVGFSETTAFRRAFRKWTGRSASQYRREMLSRKDNR